MGIATVVLVLGTLIVCIRQGLRGKTGSTPTRVPKATVYRTAEGGAGSARGAVEEAKTEEPLVVVPFSFKPVKWGVEYTCIRCSMAWQACSPDLCMKCSSCGEPHFHVDCLSDSKKRGCGATWIMLAKDAPVVTPPPKTAGDSVENPS